MEAAGVLESAGFVNVYNVLGINQWTEAGVALVVSDEDRDPSCCDATCAMYEGVGNTITAADA